jgi:hypothetical protein
MIIIGGVYRIATEGLCRDAEQAYREIVQKSKTVYATY